MFSISEVPLPGYSRTEDIVNSVTHFLGVPFCIVSLILLLKLQVAHSVRPVEIIATCLYLCTTLIVFTVSGVYHGIRPGFAKQVTRLVDHSDIYLMISGSVTALLIPNMNETNTKSTIALLIVIWSLSAIGIVLTFMDLKKFNTIQILMYVAMGWTAAFGMKAMWHVPEIGRRYVYFVLAGGLCITSGAGLYFVGKKKKYFHAVFHIFVLIGCIIIFIGTYYFHQARLA